MIDKFMEYKWAKKSKSEFETDKIMTDIQNKWFQGLGYETIYKLGCIQELKMLAQFLGKIKSVDQNDVLAMVALFKDHEDVSDLASAILEEFDYKETNHEN